MISRLYSVVMILFIFSFVILSSCTNETVTVKKDVLPPTFQGPREVTAVNDDADFDYFRVRWDKAYDNKTQFSNIIYKIYYKKSKKELEPHYAGTVTGEVLSFVFGIERSSTVTSIEDLPTYYFIVLAYDEAGNKSSNSEFLSAKSSDFHPPEGGYISSIDVLGSSKLQINWTKAVDDRTLPSNLNYKIYMDTNYIDFSYDKKVAEVKGDISAKINIPLASYQKKTIYFRVIPEDINGNINENQISRSVSVDEIKTYDAGEMTYAKGNIEINMTEIFPEDMYTAVKLPKGADLADSMITFTPAETGTYEFQVMGSNVKSEGLDKSISLRKISFSVIVYELPIEYSLFNTSEVLSIHKSDIFSFTGIKFDSAIMLYDYNLSFSYNNINYAQPDTTLTVNNSSNPVTVSVSNNYLNFINYNIATTSYSLYRTYLDQLTSVTANKGKINANKVVEVTSKYNTCHDDFSYNGMFTDSVIDAQPFLSVSNDKGTLIAGNNILSLFDSGNNPVLGFQVVNKEYPLVTTGYLYYCDNGKYEEIPYSSSVSSYARKITLDIDLVTAGSNGIFVIQLNSPEKYDIFIMPENTGDKYFYTKNRIDKINQLEVSNDGNIYALDKNGKLFMFQAYFWVEVISDVKKLYKSQTDNILLAQTTGNDVYEVAGLTVNDNWLGNCSGLVNNSIVGMDKDKNGNVWLIYPDSVNICLP